jgi:hypothetical protein
MSHLFNVNTFFNLPTQCIYVFEMILKINRDGFPNCISHLVLIM